MVIASRRYCVVWLLLPVLENMYTNTCIFSTLNYVDWSLKTLSARTRTHAVLLNFNLN
jgi:hypothetical protein